ncbi:MAG: hypothetical protein V3S14_17720, partial [Anaerolineae bacterium]
AQVAFDSYLEQKKRKGPITVDDLVADMDSVWIGCRDARIAEWANGLAAICEPEDQSDEKLESLVWDMSGELTAWNITWETPLWEPDGDEERTLLRSEQSTFVAWGIACLWWLAMEGTEIAPLLHYGRDEIETWLKNQLATESLLLRKNTRSGAVIQHRMFA